MAHHQIAIPLLNHRGKFLGVITFIDNNQEYAQVDDYRLIACDTIEEVILPPNPCYPEHFYRPRT